MRRRKEKQIGKRRRWITRQTRKNEQRQEQKGNGEDEEVEMIRGEEANRRKKRE